MIIGALLAKLKNIDCKVDSEIGIVENLKISILRFNTLMALELLHYFLNKEHFGSCAYCKKDLILSPNQVIFFSKRNSATCPGDCQSLAKNKRGKERKK